MNTSIEFCSAVASHLRTVAPLARTRTLDADDIAAALSEHAEIVAANPGATVRTRLIGGYVCNSYGYAGESDRFEVETDGQGRTTFHASRTYAEKRAHGRGDTLRTWTVGAGGGLKRAA